MPNNVANTLKMHSNEQRDIKITPNIKVKAVENNFIPDRMYGILPYEPSSSTIEG